MSETSYSPSSSPLPPETTEVLYGNENIQRRVVEAYSWIKEELDGCVESNEVAMNVRVDSIWDFFISLKNKGVKLKAVVEVTNDNMYDVKKLMELFEVRHVPGLKSNFGIVDRKSCLLHSVSHEHQPLTHAIITNSKALVQAQCFLFDTLWNKSIPAQDKIKEIEEGMKPSFIETLRDPIEIQKLSLELLESAKKEIQMLILASSGSTNGFLSEEGRQVITQSFKKTMTRGLSVRILTSKAVQEQMERLIDKDVTMRKDGARGKFQIRIFDMLSQQQHRQRLQSKVSFLIVDSKLCLVEDLEVSNENEKSHNINEALSLATYSNSESTVLTYISIFETLWAQTELMTQRRL